MNIIKIGYNYRVDSDRCGGMSITIDSEGRLLTPTGRIRKSVVTNKEGFAFCLDKERMTRLFVNKRYGNTPIKIIDMCYSNNLLDWERIALILRDYDREVEVRQDIDDNIKLIRKYILYRNNNSPELISLSTFLRRERAKIIKEKLPENLRPFADKVAEFTQDSKEITLTCKLLSQKFGSVDFFIYACEDYRWSRFVDKIREFINHSKALNYEITSGDVWKQIVYVEKAFAERKKELEESCFKESMKTIDWSEIKEVFSDCEVVVPSNYADCEKIGSDFHNCVGGYEWSNYLCNGRRGVIALYKDNNPYLCIDFEYKGKVVEQVLEKFNNYPNRFISNEIREKLGEYLNSHTKA